MPGSGAAVRPDKESSPQVSKYVRQSAGIKESWPVCVRDPRQEEGDTVWGRPAREIALCVGDWWLDAPLNKLTRTVVTVVLRGRSLRDGTSLTSPTLLCRPATHPRPLSPGPTPPPGWRVSRVASSTQVRPDLVHFPNYPLRYTTLRLGGRNVKVQLLCRARHLASAIRNPRRGRPSLGASSGPDPTLRRCPFRRPTRSTKRPGLVRLPTCGAPGPHFAFGWGLEVRRCRTVIGVVLRDPRVPRRAGPTPSTGPQPPSPPPGYRAGPRRTLATPTSPGDRLRDPTLVSSLLPPSPRDLHGTSTAHGLHVSLATDLFWEARGV